MKVMRYVSEVRACQPIFVLQCLGKEVCSIILMSMIFRILNSWTFVVPVTVLEPRAMNTLRTSLLSFNQLITVTQALIIILYQSKFSMLDHHGDFTTGRLYISWKYEFLIWNVAFNVVCFSGWILLTGISWRLKDLF